MLKHIQALGQALFLRVEAGFNVLFGDRLNPLYCLGAISYWMFWIVVAAREGDTVLDAAQFINIILDDGERRAYSFATPPAASELIELHVRLMPGGRFTAHVFNTMTAGDRVQFEGLLGTSTFRDGTKPMLLVAGATGFAPVKSMLEHAFASGFKRPLFLYWGVRGKQDLYLPELPRQWEREHANFRYVPVLSEPSPAGAWQGRTGLVHEAILADFPNLSDYEVYACGSMKMVEVARPAFIAHGLSEQSCFSDSFLPAATLAA